MVTDSTRRLIAERLRAERGRINKQAPFRVALAYPSPYFVGMSSLGYQQIYRCLQKMDGVCVERFFLPDGADQPGATIEEGIVSYESLRPLSSCDVLAFSIAYELELAGFIQMLRASGLPAESERRDAAMPLVLVGGPLTFSNPTTIAPFADAIILGEAEGLVEEAVEQIRESATRQVALGRLAEQPHTYVPKLHGEQLPTLGRCDDADLPARSVIRTPHTELSNMFLIEAERGCSRGCQYCVMRRSTNGGMRRVALERVLELVPDEAPRVGLVGAAVSDHPQITEIVNRLADRGKSVGLSSLRPDRLKEPFVQALSRAGYRTLTTALDGASERLRQQIERRGREPHYELAAERARKVGMHRLKLYLMLGLPGETDSDMDECAEFVARLSKILPIALGVSPFCPKRNTPLDGTPFAGIATVRARLARLKKGLKGRAEIRSLSVRWAWVEAVLSQGGPYEGLAVAQAVAAGGRFADYRRAFEALGHSVTGGPVRSAAEAPRLLRVVS